MGTEDWVLKGTRLITNTKQQRLKIQSTGQILKNKILKKSHKNYKENIGTKLITNTKKQKLKNLEQSLEFQKYNVKEKKKKKKEKKKSHKNYKEDIGTKLITNTKKHKLKIQSRVWSFRNTMLKKR